MIWIEEGDTWATLEGYFVRQKEEHLFQVYDANGDDDDDDDLIGEAFTLDKAKAIAEKAHAWVRAYYDNEAYERDTGFRKPM